MLKYPISTILWLSKITIKDKIKDILKLDDNIKVYVEVTVKDKNGKTIKYHKQRSHSFVANFLDIIANGFVNTGSGASIVYDFTSVAGTTSGTINTPFLNAGSGNSSYGIVVGTGTTPPTALDYKLENQIANGTGSGQLEYGSHSFNPSSGTVATSGNTSSIQISRQFTNGSGTSITVSEVGMITIVNNTSGTQYYVLIVHDLLSSPITVANLSVLQITYTISITT